VELKVINASGDDHTLSRGALSLRREGRNSLPTETVRAMFLDANQQLPVVLEPWYGCGVPSDTRREKSENRRSTPGGVDRMEF